MDPALVAHQIVDALRAHLDEDPGLELTDVMAVGHPRDRVNLAAGIEPAGFIRDADCANPAQLGSRETLR